jgi:acyl homoserine lactone synthase
MGPAPYKRLSRHFRECHEEQNGCRYQNCSPNLSGLRTREYYPSFSAALNFIEPCGASTACNNEGLFMLIRIEGANNSTHTAIIDDMLRARAEVFYDRLRWNVTVQNDKEIDNYDSYDPLYLVSVDESTGMTRGSLRLLSTSGPNMMRDIFRNFFSEPIVFQSPLIWECTRFCIHPQWERTRKSESRSGHVTTELLFGICEAAIEAGVKYITGVFNVSMTTIYRRAGWSPEVLGRSTNADSDIAYGLWQVDKDVAARLKARLGNNLVPAGRLTTSPSSYPVWAAAEL